MNAPSDLEEIQRIAYEIWQIEGEPAGRDQEHWERARKIFESRRASSPAEGDNGSETRLPETGAPEAPPPVNPGFEEVEPGKVPEMKDDPAPDLPDPPMGRFASQLQDSPD